MNLGDVDRSLVEQQIAEWYRSNVVLPDRKAHGACVRVVLQHLSVDRKPQGDVQSFPVKIDEGAEDDGEILLHKIAERAQQDATDLNQGIQTYAVYAHYAQDRNYIPRKVFRVAAGDVEVERDISPSEPATEKGLVAQTMRHLEVVMRTSQVASAQILTTMQGELRRIAEMNENFGKQQIDFMLLVQDITDNAHGRRLKEKESEASLGLRSEALAKLDVLLPVVVNRLAGKQVLPESDRTLMLMSALLENMSEQQQTSFYGMLNDSQRMVLAEMLAEYEKKKARITPRTPVSLGMSNSTPVLPTSVAMVPASPAGAPSTPPPASSIASSDPKLQQIEQDAAAFGERFRTMLKPHTTE